MRSAPSLRPWRRISRGCLVLLALLTVPSLAGAHVRSQSFSSWTVREGSVRLVYSVPVLEATRLAASSGPEADLGGLLRAHLASRVGVRRGGAPCRSAEGPRPLAARSGYLRAVWHFACADSGSIEIAVDAFFELAPSHLHYARVRVGDGPPVEHLLSDRQRRRVVATDAGHPEAAAGTGFAAYLGLGVEHILAGFDHIAFLLALLLLCRRLREVVLMVTGFTLGHSLTLTLAVLGVVEPNVPVIEALIGFTIALVAAENIGVTTGASRPIALAVGSALAGLGLWAVFAGRGPPPLALFGLALFTVCYLPLANTRARAVRLRPTLTVLFGLIHGFGFASVLMEIGLPRGRLASALFGFNIGVELGQLAIVAGLWLLGRGLVGRVAPADRRLAFDVASAALCALGLFWFVERLLLV